MNYIGWFIYFLSETFNNIKSNILTTIITIITISLSLSICGFFLGIFINLNHLIDNISNQIQVVAYLKNGLSSEIALDIKKELIYMPEVEEIEYISNEKAFSIFKEELNGQTGILEGLNANPFPASLEIKLKKAFRNSSGVEGLAARLKLIDNISDIQYAHEWIDKFSAFIRFIEVFAVMTGGALLIAAVFIVSNTIRLVVYAKQDEIKILSLLGATSIFIKTPFFITGIIDGFSGAVLSIGVLYIGKTILIQNTPSAFISIVDIPIFAAHFLPGFIISGILLGMVGSGLSLRKRIE